MTIVGKSPAAFAMIMDAISSLPFLSLAEIKIFNNLKIPGDYIFRNKKVSETDVLNDFEFILGAVQPETKRKLVNLFNLTYKTLINNKAEVSENTKVGGGCLIDGLAFVASGVTIGKYVTVYNQCSINHDSILNDYVTICPGSVICGNVKIGEGTFVGAGVTIKQDIIIGKNCIIGCGSNVVKNVPDGVTVYGNPAKQKSE